MKAFITLQVFNCQNSLASKQNKQHIKTQKMFIFLPLQIAPSIVASFGIFLAFH